MSAEDGSVTEAWGDGEYTFRLAFGQWRELQESVNKPRIEIGAPWIGPADLAQAMARGNCWPHEVREVIRLGLIGGGMRSDRALVMIKRYVETAGWSRRNSAIAATIIVRSMVGPEDDPVGKEQPPVTETPATNGSTSPDSTASALQ